MSTTHSQLSEKQEHSPAHHSTQLPPSTVHSARPSLDGRTTLVHTDSEDTEAQYDEVVPPGEEREDEKDTKGKYLVKWDGPDDPENPKVRHTALS
jgi:hypothetical protein